MINLSRRSFLKDSMLVVSAGIVMPSFLSRAVQKASAASLQSRSQYATAGTKTLIVVQLAGGNDGLNTVIPSTEGLYRDYRPTLSIGEHEIIPLTKELGLHPALKPLKGLWDSNHMAIVEGVGYPNASLSHFQAMDIWETVDLQGMGKDGWLGRYVQGLVDSDGHPFQGLSVGANLPLALRSLTKPVSAIGTLKSYRVQPSPSDPKDSSGRLATLQKLYASYPGATPYAALLEETAANAQKSSAALQKATSTYSTPVTYPKNGFAQGLQILAETIVSNLGLRVGYVTLGGFDTHSNQLETHNRLLDTLATGIAAFYQDLQAHGRAGDVVIMTWSEFGRRVKENGSVGTDHGTAAPLFIFGNAVKGGFYGEQPSLSQLDHTGNLIYTTDFRSVYATVLERWLGAPAKDVLEEDFQQQAFLPPAKF